MLDAAIDANKNPRVTTTENLRTEALPLVLLLCGGLGTRLRDVDARPKAIVPVAGRPFGAYLLRLLRVQGFERVHFLLGVGADAVSDALPELARLSGFAEAALSSTTEPSPLGTGGALAHAIDSAEQLNLILNADSFAEVDYVAMVRQHRAEARPGEASLLALSVEDRGDYGSLELSEDSHVLGFHEKGERGPGWVNGGAYLLDLRTMTELPVGKSSLELDLFPRLARETRLRGFRAQGFFRDIGTPDRLAAAQLELPAVAERLGIPRN